MQTSKSLTRREVPVWAMATVAAVAVLLLGYFGWRAVTGTEGEVGPRKKVYPGMYDLRKEAAKMQQRSGAESGGK